MKDWKHLILEQRKVIASGIAHNYKLKNLGESLDFDPLSCPKCGNQMKWQYRVC